MIDYATATAGHTRRRILDNRGSPDGWECTAGDWSSRRKEEWFDHLWDVWTRAKTEATAR